MGSDDTGAQRGRTSAVREASRRSGVLASEARARQSDALPVTAGSRGASFGRPPVVRDHETLHFRTTARPSECSEGGLGTKRAGGAMHGATTREHSEQYRGATCEADRRGASVEPSGGNREAGSASTRTGSSRVKRARARQSSALPVSEATREHSPSSAGDFHAGHGRRRPEVRIRTVPHAAASSAVMPPAAASSAALVAATPRAKVRSAANAQSPTLTAMLAAVASSTATVASTPVTLPLP